ncbi:ATP-binding protein [Streptomyces sp. NPDC012508]|uniref:ATP-binding protein n=1 Tax=Streptomyces sp. NPDC012508 TaxID=3364837 RepID=UPI003699FC2A
MWPCPSSSEGEHSLPGQPELGNTHIAVALAVAVAACRPGCPIYFASLDHKVRSLRPQELPTVDRVAR